MAADTSNKSALDRQLMLRGVLACLAIALLFVAPYSYTLVDKSGSGEGRFTGVTWHSLVEGEPNAIAIATLAGRIPPDLAKESTEMEEYLTGAFDLERWDLNLGLVMLQWIGFLLFAVAVDRLAARFLGLTKAPRRPEVSRRPPPPPPRPPTRSPAPPPSSRPGPRPGPRR